MIFLHIPCTFTFHKLVYSISVHKTSLHNSCTQNQFPIQLYTNKFTIQLYTKPVYSIGVLKTSLQHRCTQLFVTLVVSKVSDSLVSFKYFLHISFTNLSNFWELSKCLLCQMSHLLFIKNTQDDYWLMCPLDSFKGVSDNSSCYKPLS